MTRAEQFDRIRAWVKEQSWYKAKTDDLEDVRDRVKRELKAKQK